MTLDSVCLYGPGAIGSLLGFFLQRAGVRVYAVARRRSHSEALSRGVRLSGLLEGVFRPAGVGVGRPPVDSCDAALVATKAYDAPRAVESALMYTGRVAVAGNGFGGLEAARGRAVEAAGLVVDYGVSRLGDDAVEVRGLGRVLVGPPTWSSGGLARDLWGALRRGDAEASLVDDIEPWRWLKAAVNAALNPLTVLAAARNASVRTPGLWDVAVRGAMEVARVAEALGVRLPGDPVGYLAEVASRTAGNYSSMLQDLLRGGRTEVEEINGYIVKAAERLGLDVPVLRTLYLLVRGLERLGAERWEAVRSLQGM